MFTKKHYKAIAEIIKKRSEKYCYTMNSTVGEAARKLEVKHIVAELATYFENNNPRFDRNKFMAACGLDN